MFGNGHQKWSRKEALFMGANQCTKIVFHEGKPSQKWLKLVTKVSQFRRVQIGVQNRVSRRKSALKKLENSLLRHLGELLIFKQNTKHRVFLRKTFDFDTDRTLFTPGMKQILVEKVFKSWIRSHRLQSAQIVCSVVPSQNLQKFPKIVKNNILVSGYRCGS